MSLQPISVLLNPPTRDRIRSNWVQQLVSVGIPADQWIKGAVFSTILTIVATAYAGFALLMVQAVQLGFLPLAQAGWLDQLAFYVYGAIRTPPTFATGSVVLTNTSGGVYTFGPREATFLDPDTKATFVNTGGFTVGALASGVSIPIIATVAGAASTAGPGAITNIVTAMVGVTCTNPLAVVGIDAQSDPSLRVTCTDRLAARSVRGPRTAYRYYATHAADDSTLINGSGNPVNVNRVNVSPSSHTGQVQVYLASPSGVPSADDVAAASSNIETNVRPHAVTVTVIAATPVVYGPAITIWCQSTPGLDAGQVATAASTAVATYLSTYPIGGIATDFAQGLFGAKVAGEIGATNPAIYDVTGTTDLPMVAGQVATEACTFSVRIVTVN